jgi:chemotaxis protein methyltransferase CheR
MHLSTDESDFLRDLVRRESAIVLESGKEYLLETRLVTVMRSREIASFAQLISEIRRSPRSPLVTAVVEAMTTNETSFFRDLHPWETLRTDLLPELIERRSAARSLTFLCAACSSGQEPYSLAMIIREHFPMVAANWRVRILANDLSTEMVERTKAGRFSQIEIGRGLPASLMAKYFTRAGMQWQARDDLRSMIEVAPGNLAEPAAWQQLPEIDGIFLRNVLIYFSRETKTTILRAAGNSLRPDGFLMLGSSETTLGIEHHLARQQIDKTVFYRPAGALTSVAGRPGSPSRTAAGPTPGLGASVRSPRSEVAPLAASTGLRSSFTASPGPRPSATSIARLPATPAARPPIPTTSRPPVTPRHRTPGAPS